MSYVEQLLTENEEIVRMARQSWVVLVGDAIINLIIAVVIIGVTMVVVGAGVPFGIFVALLMLIPAARFVLQYINWWNRAYIVTNRRVIQVEGTVNKNVIDSSLEKVNDVKLTQSVLGRLLNYGDVEILTASELGTNRFDRLHDPIGFKTAMLEEKEKLGSDEAGSPSPISSGSQPSDVPKLIASLSALRSQGMITEEEFQKKKAELLARM